MQTIVIVSDDKGFMAMSIRDKVKEFSYNAVLCGSSVDEISKIKDDVAAYIIYSDEDLASDMDVLTYLKDRAVEGDIGVFVIGNPTEIEDVCKIFPQFIVKGTFARPFNVQDAVAVVDKFVKTEGNAIKKKILVIDDSGAVLRNVKSWLEPRYQVIPANSGTMGIKYLSTNRPDLVLLDYEMPVINGAQVLEMIRSEADFSNIPVIFLTSKDDKESVLKVMALKPEGYLLKTLPPADIIAAVDDFFAQQKLKNI